MHSIRRNAKLFCHTHYSALIILCFILCMFSACSANPFNQPTETHKTPTPAMAGGEPVLTHSQIHFHDAPLPGQLSFADGNWTLAGRDTFSTRSVTLSACCSAQPPAPAWFHS